MIYFLQQSEGSCRIKIGYTGDETPLNRLAGLQTGNPYPLRVICTFPGTQTTEGELHDRFAFARRQGEWFDPVPEILLFMLQSVVTGKAVVPPDDLDSLRTLEAARFVSPNYTHAELPIGLEMDARKGAVPWSHVCEAAYRRGCQQSIFTLRKLFQEAPEIASSKVMSILDKANRWLFDQRYSSTQKPDYIRDFFRYLKGKES